MSNIFSSEAWVSAVAEEYKFARAHAVALSSGVIYVREFSFVRIQTVESVCQHQRRHQG